MSACSRCMRIAVPGGRRPAGLGKIRVLRAAFLKAVGKATAGTTGPSAPSARSQGSASFHRRDPTLAVLARNGARLPRMKRTLGLLLGAAVSIHPARPRRRRRSSASSGAPPRTPPPRSRRRPAGRMRATGARSPSGARPAAWPRSRRRRRPSRRSWPQRPTASSARSRSRAARRRSPPPTRAQDHPNPCDSGAVAAVLSGIRRQLGTAPTRRAAPLDLDPLARLLQPIEQDTLGGRRDRTLLLLGFAAALRRSELVALDVEDLAFDLRRGLLVNNPCLQDRPGAGRNAGRGAVRARETICARSARSRTGYRPPASTAVPRSGGCAAATP